MAKLYDFYKKKVVFRFMDKFHCTSSMQVPKIQKITVNMGVGKAAQNKALLKNAIHDLALITGQHPIITRAKKSISGFKLRQNFPIGCKVTLRKKRMWEFFERLICISIPRIRDFRGLSPLSFDGRGNYNLGIREQIIFPEIEYNKIDKVRGLDISITTNAESDKRAYFLLIQFNFPFSREHNKHV